MTSAVIFASKVMNYFRIVFSGEVREGIDIAISFDSDCDRTAFEIWSGKIKYLSLEDFGIVVKREIYDYYLKKNHRHPNWFSDDWIESANVTTNESDVCYWD